MPENAAPISPSHLSAGRAVDQLRRQLGIVLQEDGKIHLGACPVESLTPALLSQLRALPQRRLFLLLTAARARMLKLPVQENRAVRIDAETFTLAELQSFADPLMPPVSVEGINFERATASQDMLLGMAKYATLLPAMLIVESSIFPQDWLSVSAVDVASYWAAPPLDIVPLAHAALPIEGAQNATLHCFRTRYGTSTHLALIVGDISADSAPLTRIHSSCITGDILGSLRCDCGDQLKLALSQITSAGSGILLYLHQEGRGIGIVNKIRAYALQEQGMDTYDANLALGYGEDERDFRIAAGMLKTLGVKCIRLLSNNPHKIASIEVAGITVSERVPLVIKAGDHNHAYLEAKSKKAGHLF